MHTIFIMGMVLSALGIIAIFVPAVTFFTNKKVADAGFFSVSMAKPHTIVFNPVVGMV